MNDDPRSRPLDERDVDPDPLQQFAAWFAEARAAGIELAEAMALATASLDGAPSARMVLLKHHDERGFVFNTTLSSRKGRELEANPRGSLLFYWHEHGRQVRIEGRVEPLTDAEADEYFRARPRGSQLSAIATPQGEVVASRDELERRVAGLDARHVGAEVPRPKQWGGFRLAPDAFEFWQHRPERLHDRLRYRRDDGTWVVERLAP